MKAVELVLWLWLIGIIITAVTFSIRCDRLESRIKELEKEKTK